MLFLPALSLLSLLTPTTQAVNPHRARRHSKREHHDAAQLQERGLPITATTTVVVDMTATHTVWVQPTNQVVWGGSSATTSDPLTSLSSFSAQSVSSASFSTSSVGSAAVSSVTDSSSSALSSSTSSWSRTTTYLRRPTPSTGAVGSTTQLSSLSASTSNPMTSDPLTASPLSASYSGSSTYSPTTTYLRRPTPSTGTLASSSTASPSANDTASPTMSSSSSAATDSMSVTAQELSSTSTMPSGSLTGSASATQSLTVSSSAAASSSASTTSLVASSATASVTATSSTLASSASASAYSTVSVASSSPSSFSSSPSSSSSSFSSSAMSSATQSVTFSVTASATASVTSSVTASLTGAVTAATATATSAANLDTLGPVLMNGYYPDWSGWYLAPESIDWSKFDVVDFAFALPTAAFGLEFTQDDSSSLLTRLVTTAHAAGKRVKLSIGGWTGSTYFSTICASSSNRQTFINNIMLAYDAYSLDGIDIDWEYPGTQGAGTNAVSPYDSANFLIFLTELRAALPQGALISTAVQVWPYADTNGNPMADVSGFAAVIDWILIMNYDVWGSSSTPGANAPLEDGCGNSSQPLANAYAAVSSWTTAGMPANQITLGVPAYGYLQISSAMALKDRRRGFPSHRRGTNGTSTAKRSSVTLYNDNGGSTDGQIMFESLISQGSLAIDSNSGEYVGAGGFTREWDSCSSTPWLRSSTTQQIVTYDDPQSMSLKGQFAAQAGLRGCNVFSMDGDWTGSSWPLTNAVRSGLGL